MKIRFPLKNRKREKLERFLPLLLIFFVVLLIYLFFPNLVSSTAFFFARPIIATERFISSSFVSMGERFIPGALVGENDLLQKRVENTKELELQNAILRSENSSLRKLLSIEKQNETIRAGIITRPPTTPFDIITIDAGKKDDVLPESLVLYAHSALLGVVVETGESTSKVELLSSPGKVTEGILQNSNTVILLTGRGGGNFISMLPQDFEIAVGDVVVAPGKEGYSIARVATIRSDPADSFKGVLLVSVTNIQEARFVDVVVSLK